MKHIIYSTLLVLLILTACQSGDPSTSETGGDPTPASDQLLGTRGLLDALTAIEATIEQGGEVEQPFFSVPGEVFTVNGQDVQVFEYGNAALADAEVALVAPDGSSIGTNMASWIGPPHFYHEGRLIVLYVGSEETVLELLETILGSQFAGAEGDEGPDMDAETPSAILIIGEDHQVSGIGSYCWIDPASEIGICEDKLGIPTPPEPMVVENPFIAQFVNPLNTLPDTLVLSTIPVTADDKMPAEDDGKSWWPPNPGEQFDIPLEAPHQVEMSLDPGLYVFNIFAQWEGVGDVSYGYLVEVSPAQDSDSPPNDESGVSSVVILAEAGLNLRSAPDLSSEVIGIIPRGELVEVIRGSEDGNWWQVACPDGAGGTCWLSADPVLSEPVDLSDFSLSGLVYVQTDQQPEQWLIKSDGTPTLLFDDQNYSGVLSPDGRQVISWGYPRGETNLTLVDLETGERLQLTDTAERFDYNPQWWPANPDTIVFVSNEFNLNDQPRPGPGNLAMVKTDGTGYQVLDSEHIINTLSSLSPDGQRITYTHLGETAYDDGILTPWIYDLESGPTPFDYQQYGLGDMPNLSFGSSAWSPDGHYLAWIVGGDLTADGDWKNGVAMFDLEENSIEILYPHVPASCLFAWCPSTPLWSPDGQWLAWQVAPEGGAPSILVMRPDRSEQQLFEYAGGLVWNPDGRLLVYEDILKHSILVMEVGQWDAQRTALPPNANPVMWINIEE